MSENPQDVKDMPLGDWFLTQSGRMFWPLHPRACDMEITDIAHALSHICRYGGHCNPFYSVAQHSVHVSKLVSRQHQRAALLHDATEAYCGDMVRPLKYQIPQYQIIEDAIWKVVAEKFDLNPELDGEVKVADDVALMTERRDLMPHHVRPWATKAEPDERRIMPLGPEAARYLFMERYRELFL